jgi:hypothetical protein
MTCFKSERQLKKEEIRNSGYILLSEYCHNNLLRKDERGDLIKAAKEDGSFLIYDRNIYIKSSFEFKERKGNCYVANVICVLNALLRNYSYLSNIITIESGVAFMQDMRIYYDNKKQRAYFEADGKQIDMMSYVRDYINSKEETEKGNNTYDYCPNHLISCFN